MSTPYNLGPPTEIPQLANKLHGRLWDTAIGPKVKIWADRQMDQIQADLDQIDRGDEGYKDFLASFVSREYERTQFDEDDEHPYDTLRETPLCTCRDFACPLTEGRLPAPIREADDLESAIREFVMDHAGDPLVLDHDGDADPGARQAWSRKKARVWSVLRAIEAYTDQGRQEPPTEEELAGSRYVDVLEPGTDEYAVDERAKV